MDANGSPAGVRIIDTCGCSGAQIIAAAGLGDGLTRYGITLPALQAWIASLPFQVKATDPTDGARLRGIPQQMTVDFNHAVLSTSVQASDLLVDGAPATGVSIGGTSTLIFDLPALGEGVHTVTVSAGAILDAQGSPLAAFASQFNSDLTAPRVVSSSIQDGMELPAGDLTYSVAFSEPMATANLDASGFQLHGTGLNVDYPSASFLFDATGTSLNIRYSGLPEDEYRLTLISFDGAFEDTVGFKLDGEPTVFPIPPNTSGDGVEGGNFVVEFSLKEVSPAAFPIARVRSAVQRDLMGRAQKRKLAGQSTATTAAAASSVSSFFELDGNTTTTTSHDWEQVYLDFKNGGNLSGTGAINFYNDPVPIPVPGVVARTEDSFSGGNSKDIYDISQWAYGTSAPQNKANLENGIAASYLDPDNSNHTYLYVGATRYDNSGSIALGVWFLQNPIAQSGGRFYRAKTDGTADLSVPETHVNGDLLLVANFGSGTPVITSYTWNNGGIPATGTTISASIGTAIVNSVPLDGAGGNPPAVPWPFKSSGNGTAGNFVQAGEFFEAGVDLNLLFPNHVGPFNFSSFVFETRASASQNSTLSDFIVGHVSTAPDVMVTKVADATTVDAGSQVGFTVTLENVGVGDLANVTLVDTLPSGGGNDIIWSIPAGGNPSSKFVLTGAGPGGQTLTLMPNTSIANAAAPISVHIVGTSSGNDIGSLSNTATVAADNEDAVFFGSNNQSAATISIVKSGIDVVSPQSAVEGASTAFKMGTFTSASSGQVYVSVNWGDGTPNTTFSFANTPNVAFAMLDQSHTYAEEGSFLVTETVTLGSSVKTGFFTVVVSDPKIIATATYPIPAPFKKTYDGLIVGTQNLATFTDPGGAEPNSSDSGTLDSHYSATVNWGGTYGTSPGIINFSGTTGSKDGVFTINASVPYKDAGTYSPTVTIIHENSTLGTAESPHVFITDTFIIDPKALTVTANSRHKTYGATLTSVDYTGTLTGVVATDGITASYDSPTGDAANATVAGNTYLIIATLSDPGNRLGNYTVVNTPGALTVDKAALTVTANNQTKTYGVALTSANFTGVLNGVVAGDNITASYDSAAGDQANATVAGSTYSIIATLNDPDSRLANYTVVNTSGALTVNRAPLTVTANSRHKTYGVTLTAASYTGTLTGVVALDAITASYDSPSGDPANATVIGNTYTIIATLSDPGNRLSNYTVVNTPGALTVDKAPLTVTANNLSKTYGVALTAANFTGMLSGVVAGDNITASYDSPAGDPANATVAGSTYAIVATLIDPNARLANYTVVNTPGALTVNKAPLTVTANSRHKDYGVLLTAANYTGTLSGVVAGDSITASYDSPTGDPATATAGSTYAIIATLIDPGSRLVNYTVSNTPGTLTVDKAHLTVTADNKSFNEGTTPNGLSATITGFANGQNLGTSGVTGSPSVTTTVTGTTAPGTYVNAITATLGSLTAVNYDFTPFNPGTLTVVDVAPTITMSSGSITLRPGDGFTRPGSFTDPGSVVATETWTITTNYGDGSPVSGPTATTPGTPITIGHIYPTTTVSPFTVTVTIADNYGASSVRTFQVFVSP